MRRSRARGRGRRAKDEKDEKARGEKEREKEGGDKKEREKGVRYTGGRREEGEVSRSRANSSHGCERGVWTRGRTGE